MQKQKTERGRERWGRRYIKRLLGAVIAPWQQGCVGQRNEWNCRLLVRWKFIIQARNCNYLILGKINWLIRLCQISVNSTPILFFYYKQRSAEMAQRKELAWSWAWAVSSRWTSLKTRVKICAFCPQTARLKETNPWMWMFRGNNTHSFECYMWQMMARTPCVIKEILHFVQLEKIRDYIQGLLEGNSIRWRSPSVIM